MVPGFISHQLSATRKRRHHVFFYSSFTMTRMRANRGEFQMRRNRVTQSQGGSGLVNKFSRIQDPVRVKVRAMEMGSDLAGAALSR
jgi:hypothetical protein